MNSAGLSDDYGHADNLNQVVNEQGHSDFESTVTFNFCCILASIE